jgi:hypothetical protein
MSVTDFFARLRRYDENACVIFDRAEPIGQPTDLVLPYRRWFRRRARQKPPNEYKSAANDS